MTTCITKETIEIVEELNEEIFETLGEKIHGNYPFEFMYMNNGWAEGVEFLGHQIWSTENDEREYININTPAEDYEPLEDYLRREATKICKMIGKLEFDSSQTV